MFDVAIIGGGAAGMSAAYFAAVSGAKCVIIERNARVGRKIMITGKGRCNLTNLCERDTFINAMTKNGRFMYSAFSAFSPEDVISLINHAGVPTKVERGRRVFPQSDKAVDIVDALHDLCVGAGVKIINGRAVDISQNNGIIDYVLLEDGERVYAKNYIIATGGMSYPATGSTGDGYALARSVGHEIVPPTPSLIPLEIHEGFCSELMGLSLKNVTLTAVDTSNNKTLYSELGEMIFTHFGVSGPLVLSASAHLRPMEEMRYRLIIDLKPALDEKTLDDRILRDFSENINREFVNSLSALLPKKLIPIIVRLSGIEPRTKVNQITKEQREGLIRIIKNMELNVTGTRPIEEAIVTSGGVDVHGIDPKTMRSKICENLFFAGEVIDVDAYTGGYNLQIAFSTGHLAGMSAAAN